MVMTVAFICTFSLTCLCDVQANALVGLWPKFDPRKKGTRRAILALWGTQKNRAQSGSAQKKGPRRVGSPEKFGPHAGDLAPSHVLALLRDVRSACGVLR